MNELLPTTLSHIRVPAEACFIVRHFGGGEQKVLECLEKGRFEKKLTWKDEEEVNREEVFHRL